MATKKRAARKKRRMLKKAETPTTVTPTEAKAPGKEARKLRKQYSPEKRAAILAEASDEQMTGKQVAAKYNISVVTYYLWKKKGGARVPRRESAPAALQPLGLSGAVRAAVQAKVREVLPGIVAQEVGLHLNRLFGRSRGR